MSTFIKLQNNWISFLNFTPLTLPPFLSHVQHSTAARDGEACAWKEHHQGHEGQQSVPKKGKKSDGRLSILVETRQCSGDLKITGLNKMARIYCVKVQ